MDMKLELIGVPVSDVDRAKDFYNKIGFVCDVDQRVSDEIRFIQFTPPGSACSIAFGQGISTMKPGSLDGLQAVVKSAEEARQYMLDRGIEVSEVDVQDWGSFVYFKDPDGNGWSLQELPNYAKAS